MAEGPPAAWIRPAIDLHKSFGLTVLGLVLVRILWRLSHPAPPFPSGYRRLERVGAHVPHILLYGLIFLLPISGWLHDSAFKGCGSPSDPPLLDHSVVSHCHDPGPPSRGQRVSARRALRV